MSSWLNAAALAGSAAIEQHLASTQEGYTADLDQAHSNALAALSLLPDIQRASERFSRLAERRTANSGWPLTGSSGMGSVVQLLSQMSAQMRELEAGHPEANRETVAQPVRRKARSTSPRCAASSRGQALSSRAPISFGEGRRWRSSGVVAALEQTSIAPSVARAAQDLSFRLSSRRWPDGQSARS